MDGYTRMHMVHVLATRPKKRTDATKVAHFENNGVLDLIYKPTPSSMIEFLWSINTQAD